MEPSVPITPREATTPTRNFAFGGLVESLRPQQWVKNGFVFAALIFSRSITDWHRNARVAAGALLFCLISSAVYLLNDILDAPEDRKHPLKRLRPLASGRLGVGTAAIVAIILAILSLYGAWILDRTFFIIVLAYGVINVLYSWALKRVVLLDVFVISAGFVLRVISGGVIIHVEISPWLVVCATLLALFLALSKRRHELVALGKDAGEHRSILAHYSPYFLDQLIGIVTASTVMSYALYTLSNDVQVKFPGKRLDLTIPFVLFGIFRYLYLVHQNEEGGNPTRLLFADLVLLSVVLFWAASVIFIIYL
ncbi:MAG: decaprenyl-phosphate phosphoribosyltransferase [Terriglobia bacterium]|jgi:4-hydroxybenzoate polyprenyltransferase